MKNKYIIACLLLLLYVGKAQAQFESFQKNTSIEYFSVDQKMFDMMGKLNPHSTKEEDVKFRNLVKKLNSLEVFTTRNASVFEEMNTEAREYISQKGMKQLSEWNPLSKKVTFYVNTNATKENIQELLMIVDGTTEYNVMKINGNFALKDLALLTSKMKFHTGINFNELSK